MSLIYDEDKMLKVKYLKLKLRQGLDGVEKDVTFSFFRAFMIIYFK